MNEYIQFSEILLEVLGIFDFGVKWRGALKTSLYIIILGTMHTTGVLELVTTMNDFSRFAENISLLLVAFTGIVKYCTLIYSREKMRNFRDMIKFNKVSGPELKIDDHSIVDSYDQAGLKFSKNYGWILCAVCQGMLLQVLPGIFLGHGLQLPFPAVYPYSLNSTAMMFTIAYAHQTIGVYIYVLIYTAFDSWFIFLVHHACGHFCLLQDLLEKIAEADQESKQIHERIKKCVRLHQNVLKFSEDIENVFNVSNLMQFLVSSVAICISGYQVVMTGLMRPELLVKHLSSVCGQIVQLLIFNWCGQLMEEKSLGVTHAISRSKLYKLEVDHQRDLGLILLRAQRPACITAGKFSNLSLQNFTNLMKASMSYFTMLTSVEENQNAELVVQ